MLLAAAVLIAMMYLGNLENTQEVRPTLGCASRAFIPLFHVLQTLRGFRDTGYLGNKNQRYGMYDIWWRGTELMEYPIFRKDIPKYRVENLSTFWNRVCDTQTPRASFSHWGLTTRSLTLQHESNVNLIQKDQLN